MLRDELNESFDHALRAAGHAAGGVGAAVGPRVEVARETMLPRVRGAAARGWGSTVAVFTPLTEAAQAKVDSRSKDPKRKARQVRRKAAKTSRKRWPALLGLLAGGAAVGAAGAMVLRRRRQQWQDIDANQSLEPAAPAAGPTSQPPTSQPAAAGSATAPSGKRSEKPSVTGGESPPADPAEPPAEQASATTNNRRS